MTLIGLHIRADQSESSLSFSSIFRFYCVPAPVLASLNLFITFSSIYSYNDIDLERDKCATSVT